MLHIETSISAEGLERKGRIRNAATNNVEAVKD
jgi:hypothetical protein